MLSSINKEQKLYVTPCGGGFSCLGFDVCHNKTIKLAKELDREDLIPTRKGTKKAYNNYETLVSLAREKNIATGWQSKAGLTPELIGKEGHRVEVVTSYGEKVRFIVGKSTGWIPCHLEIKRTDSSGGGGAIGSPYKSIKIVEYNAR